MAFDAKIDKNKTKIMQCSCTHEYQDSKYGKGMRVFNPTLKSVGIQTTYRCTVCKKELIN